MGGKDPMNRSDATIRHMGCILSCCRMNRVRPETCRAGVHEGGAAVSPLIDEALHESVIELPTFDAAESDGETAEEKHGSTRRSSIHSIRRGSVGVSAKAHFHEMYGNIRDAQINAAAEARAMRQTIRYASRAKNSAYASKPVQEQQQPPEERSLLS
jgi:hypothetical protein